jgi:hypothetical protein
MERLKERWVLWCRTVERRKHADSRSRIGRSRSVVGCRAVAQLLSGLGAGAAMLRRRLRWMDELGIKTGRWRDEGWTKALRLSLGRAKSASQTGLLRAQTFQVLV